jgi:hypothetical protein
MEKYINLADLDYCKAEKPFLSVWLEFVRKNAAEILDFGEFEALRRWLLSSPACVMVPITPQSSHKVTREFLRSLKVENKN